MSERKTTSLRVDPEIWKKVKVYCVENDLDISKYIEKLIKKEDNKKRSLRENESKSKNYIEHRVRRTRN